MSIDRYISYSNFLAIMLNLEDDLPKLHLESVLAHFGIDLTQKLEVKMLEKYLGRKCTDYLPEKAAILFNEILSKFDYLNYSDTGVRLELNCEESFEQTSTGIIKTSEGKTMPALVENEDKLFKTLLTKY